METMVVRFNLVPKPKLAKFHIILPNETTQGLK